MKLHTEVMSGVVLLGIIVLLLNPMHLLMPTTLYTMGLLLLVVAYLAFFGLIWRENAQDEREHAHIQKSGRQSFLVGVTILIIGILFQARAHSIDPWLLYALAGMVLVKLISRFKDTFHG